MKKTPCVWFRVWYIFNLNCTMVRATCQDSLSESDLATSEQLNLRAAHASLHFIRQTHRLHSRRTEIARWLEQEDVECVCVCGRGLCVGVGVGLGHRETNQGTPYRGDGHISNPKDGLCQGRGTGSNKLRSWAIRPLKWSTIWRDPLGGGGGEGRGNLQ